MSDHDDPEDAFFDHDDDITILGVAEDRVIEMSGVIAAVSQSFLENKAQLDISFPSAGHRHDVAFHVRGLTTGAVLSGDKPEVRVFVVLPEGWRVRK
jgi:hypothetical protein